MSDAVMAAILSSVVTLAGVLIANGRAQAVTDTKIEELTREVREHNNFARRVPVMEEQLRSVTRRIGELERREKRE